MSGPSPMLFFETVNAYQRTAAIKAAIELGVFTAIPEGGATAGEIAASCAASERGTRILCDYLTILGFLHKSDGRYTATPDTALFLNQNSPAYMGGAIGFLLAPMMADSFRDLTATVKAGTTQLEGNGSVEPDHPVWVEFARSMAPMMMMPAQMMAEILPVDTGRPCRVLDIAAGHGVFGITLARKYPNVEVVAVDWDRVLDVARENAQGLEGRYTTRPGSAFDVDFGEGYDIVLLTNFLHHFDVATNEALLRKVHAALKPGGVAATLEFVPWCLGG